MYSSAFQECSKLTINSLNSVPPLIEYNIFYKVDKTTCVLNVPVDSKIEYQLEPYWKDFFNINEVDFAGIEEIVVDDDVTIAVNGGNIVVNGVDDNVMVKIYNIGGKMIYHGTATEIPTISNGFYIVKVANKTTKITI